MPIPTNYVSPLRMSAKERALSQIQRWIIDGTLQPGEKLFDAELADSLGVSRTPIREALQLLEVQGLVSTRPGKETIVTVIEKDDIFKMYPTMAALQALAAEATAQVILPEQIEQLKAINEEFAAAIKSGQAYQAMETDEQFHNLIMELSDNPYAASFSASLQIHIRRFKYVFLQQSMTATGASVEEHAAIIEAFEQKDSERAHALMKQNFIRPMQELHGLL
ncbi:DNA-binding GntR family transcriptional regulator [Paenibacillus cellulosilyticus]|uniref:DNA-binding GntR family transcriptional regulator n=1 Tax=Paenibacillus cellulosilyticus TaxID=375489 RepID=A0A2V2YRC6_9BACL|nr:GntR family transcriptional regulator [Paenibacillus cellulosilyticus]PWV95899.1 DNA-binding GntR family transcriptional regulator [Paenibacillus cellulosilyticus]QKS47767.1 GntR family transcriptional regulator [Paenibacillus cellulosilyticus]